MKHKVVALTTLILIFVTFNANAIEMLISFEDKEQPPYYLGSKDIPVEKPGITVEMIKMLEKQIDGLKIHLRRTPWKRCTIELSRNKVLPIRSFYLGKN